MLRGRTFRVRWRAAAAAGAGALCVAALVTTVSRAGAVPAPGPAAATAWNVDLAALGLDEVNVRHSGGISLASAAFRPSADPDHRGYAMIELAPRTVARTGQVRVETAATVPAGASVVVDVRGRLAGGGWTEWRAPVGGTATLAAPATTVQARLTLRGTATASPQVRGLRLTALPATGVTANAVTALAVSSRVFATREGLVGGRTANGHTIRSRDHFVALPSRRGLSPNGSAQFSVRVCNPNNGRCETAPVWDVGPWNTKDDYWNPSSVRENWRDLPQGKPQAQAAFLEGYNGGHDEFGRRVGNPAGIDLADGTFWDGLGMNDNGYVTVTYLWTSGGGNPAPSWPTVQQGAAGERVRTIQYLLNAAGAALSVDGSFGPATAAAVRSFQSGHGLGVDGVVGSQTWPRLAVTIRQGSTGSAVRALQSQLTAHGFPTSVDGNFGPATAAGVRAFQSANGFAVDGVVGPQTWQGLVA